MVHSCFDLEKDKMLDSSLSNLHETSVIKTINRMIVFKPKIQSPLLFFA
jgi:hypothetical protein